MVEQNGNGAKMGTGGCRWNGLELAYGVGRTGGEGEGLVGVWECGGDGLMKCGGENTGWKHVRQHTSIPCVIVLYSYCSIRGTCVSTHHHPLCYTCTVASGKHVCQHTSIPCLMLVLYTIRGTNALPNM